MANRSEIDTPAGGAAGPGPGDIAGQVERESERRVRLGVPSVAGGVLYLLASITVTATVKDRPTVGVIQGIAPALGGQANPAVSPGAAEVRFFDHHAFGLIAGAAMTAVAVLALLVVLRFLVDATRLRKPRSASAAGPLILVGGVGFPLLNLLGVSVLAVNAHNFVTGHDFTTDAVERALTKNTAYEILGFATPLTAIALVAGMIALMISSVRVGLQPRWMGILGGVGAMIVLVPSQTLAMIPAFWMVGTGILLMGRWPGGDPPAWAAGEARPWPSQAQVRAERGGARSAVESMAPEPVQPAPRNGAKRRRKRGSRR
jgi:hypothetical protein